MEAVIAPDDVSLVSDSTGTALRFEKFLEGRNVAITITSTKKSTLTLKSALIINEKSGGRTPSANANALAGTPGANSRSSTNNSITENAEKSNHSAKKSSEISTKRFALTENAESIEKYTEKQYNSFGWARYAEALSKNELDDLYSKIQARTTLRTFKQSSNGEAIIEVNKKPHTTLDVDNVFVSVKGKKNDFTISRVVRFNAETETEMEIVRRELYEGRSCSDTHLAVYLEEGLAREYRRENLSSFVEYEERRSNGETSRGTNQDNRQSGKYRSRYSLTVGENGEVVERFALTGDEDLDAIFGDIDMNAETDGESFDIEAVLERGIPRKPGTSNLTIGEMKKTIANNTHYPKTAQVP